MDLSYIAIDSNVLSYLLNPTHESWFRSLFASGNEKFVFSIPLAIEFSGYRLRGIDSAGIIGQQISCIKSNSESERINKSEFQELLNQLKEHYRNKLEPKGTLFQSLDSPEGFTHIKRLRGNKSFLLKLMSDGYEELRRGVDFKDRCLNYLALYSLSIQLRTYLRRSNNYRALAELYLVYCKRDIDSYRPPLLQLTMAFSGILESSCDKVLDRSGDIY